MQNGIKRNYDFVCVRALGVGLNQRECSGSESEGEAFKVGVHCISGLRAKSTHLTSHDTRGRDIIDFTSSIASAHLTKKKE